ncbi:MAG: cell division protein ZapA [Neisseria sp.]|nr:cell division protein ZapA [Neisseria sp.]
MSQTVNVEVMGRKLTLAAPEDEAALLRQAVVLLNRKVDAVRAQKNIIESDKILIVAALNLAHDFLRESGSDGLDLDAAERKIDAMLQLCRHTATDC